MSTNQTNSSNKSFASEQIFASQEALERVDFDYEFFGELLETFEQDYELRQPELHEAIQMSDAARLQSIAHSLKSALGNLGAKLAAETAFALEKMGRSGETSEAQDSLRELEERIKLFQNTCRAFLADPK